MAKKTATTTSESEKYLKNLQSRSAAQLRRKIAAADKAAFIERATIINRVNASISEQEMAGKAVLLTPYDNELRLIRAYEENKFVCFIVTLASPEFEDRTPFKIASIGFSLGRLGPLEEAILALLDEPFSPTAVAA